MLLKINYIKLLSFIHFHFNYYLSRIHNDFTIVNIGINSDIMHLHGENYSVSVWYTPAFPASVRISDGLTELLISPTAGVKWKAVGKLLRKYFWKIYIRFCWIWGNDSWSQNLLLKKCKTVNSTFFDFLFKVKDVHLYFPFLLFLPQQLINRTHCIIVFWRGENFILEKRLIMY